MKGDKHLPNVIVKSRYITSSKHMTKYLNYMATREGVELLPDSIKNNKATDNQKQFINLHKTEIKTLAEYKEYLLFPTVLNASKTITAYLNEKEKSTNIYLKYAYKKSDQAKDEKSDSNATPNQKAFIESHIKGLDDLLEYQDYLKNPTFENASECITAIAEYNLTDPLIYVNYIANRPGVVKLHGDTHGLFNMNGKADLKVELSKLKDLKSVAWTHIISLKREDAHRLNFEDAESWRKVISANAPKIAKLYNIDMKNINILGAFHNEGHHPHVHLFVYSDLESEGKIPKAQMEKAGERMRSMFTNSIFRNDMQPLIVKRNELRNNMTDRIKTLSLFYKKDFIPSSNIVASLYELSKVLPTNGKLTYAYLQQDVKKAVNNCLKNIVNKDELLGGLVSEYFSLQRELFEKYNDNQEKIDTKYIDFVEHFFEPRTGKFEKEQDLTTLHNIIIKTACDMRSKKPNTFSIKESDDKKQSSDDTKNDASSDSFNSKDNTKDACWVSLSSKNNALIAVRLLATSLVDLCNTVDCCSRHHEKKKNFKDRRQLKHRKKCISNEEGNLR